MAVSKRLRYEVLRRDEFKCRYCHKDDIELTVDHVVPVALGGTDDPSNLAAACKSCNGGKTSTTPDAPLVAQVRNDAMRWQTAWNTAVAEAEQDGEQRSVAIATVRRNYVTAYTARYGSAPILGDGADTSIGRWIDLGLPLALIDKAISAAIGHTRVRPEGRFAYFAGCCWSALRELQDRTGQILKHAVPPTDIDEGDGEVDETCLADRVAESFARGWNYEAGAAGPGIWRLMAAYTAIAAAAGYDEATISHAAFSAARDRHADLSLYLTTFNDVVEVEADADPNNPFGRASTDVDVLPSQAERDSIAVADAAVAMWRAAWRDSLGDPPSTRSAEGRRFHAWARNAYLSTQGAAEVLRGAEWAGSGGGTDLSTAIDESEAHRATEPAAFVWSTAWRTATGTTPSAELQDAFWKDCYALLASDVWDYRIIAAAAFAGAHATTRMHFSLTDEEAESIGVFAPAQRIEDLWAHAWNATHSRWPTEENRAELRARLSVVGKGGAHIAADVRAAAVATAVYRDTDLSPTLPRSLSVFEAAAHLPQLGGE